jgi:hypothetical protein
MYGEALSDSRVSPDLSRALRLSRPIVLHLGSWPDAAWAEHSSLAFFLSLSSLFEEAVSGVVAEIVAPKLVVRKGRALSQSLFVDNHETFVADPDIVASGATGVSFVGDCKYKDLGGGTPAHDDVYQLLCHCEAFATRMGVLIYPGGTCSAQLVGTTPALVALHRVTVRPRFLKQDLREVLSSLALESVGP